MQRILGAIREGRCAIAVGGRAWKDPHFVAGLAERGGMPLMALGGEHGTDLPAASPEVVGAAAAREGGVLVLLEPDPIQDGAALKALNSGIGGWPHRPRLVIVAKQFNPFLFPTPLRTLKVQQLKQRSRDFLFQLPVGDAPSTDKKKATKKGRGRAPQLAFLGREEETAALVPLVEKGGPVVVVGPPGIGRSWLIDRAISKAEGMTRMPDLALARGVGFATLASRLIEMTGDEELRKLLLPEERPSPVEVVDRIVEALADESLAGKVLVISGLQYHLARDGSIYREDRLGLLLQALLLGSYAPTLIFRSTRKPVFFREGQAADLGILELGGLQGKELYDLFAAYDASEIPRDQMGRVHERTFGHPIATRFFAITWRDADNRDQLLADEKFFRLKSSDDTESLRRRLQRRLEKATEEQRKTLALIAHIPVPVPAVVFSELGINRHMRLELLRLGLLDGLAERSPREFHVHPVVRNLMSRRETSDFDTLEMLGHKLLESSKKVEAGLQELNLIQLGNRLLIEARRDRSAWELPWPDHDARLESIRGLLAARTPRVDLAEQFSRSILKQDPGNPEAHMLVADVLQVKRADAKQIQGLYTQAEKSCPTPEIFHAHAGWRLGGKHGVQKAIEVLERAVAAFPENARLKRRIANLLLDIGRPTDAEAHLRAAMDLQPMMPDTYSLLGKLALSRGPSGWDTAEELLREALGLEPEGTQHRERLGSLLRQRGLADADRRQASWDEAKELLDAAIKTGSRNGRAYLELAQLHLDRLALGLEADMERAEWLLKKASKMGQAKTDVQLALARVQARIGKVTRAEETLERLSHKLGLTPALLAAQAELLAFSGRIFKAEQAFNDAYHKAPDGSPEKELYLAEVTRLRALIESGAALEIEKQAEAAAAGEVVAEEEEVAAGPRREAGRTVKRRRGGGKGRKKKDVAEAAATPKAAAAEVEAVPAPEPEAAPEAEAAPDLEGASPSRSEGSVRPEPAPEAAPQEG